MSETCAAWEFFVKDELLRQISLHDAEKNWQNFKRGPWAYLGGGIAPKHGWAAAPLAQVDYLPAYRYSFLT